MTLYDRIATSAPVNRQAALSSAQGTAFAPRAKIQDYLTELPPMRSAAYYAEQSGNPEFIDFRGEKIGRLKILGMMIKKGKTPSSWVCRCVCGYFCTRTAKSLRIGKAKGNTFVDRCGMCEYSAQLSRGWSPNLNGKGQPA